MGLVPFTASSSFSKLGLRVSDPLSSMAEHGCGVRAVRVPRPQAQSPLLSSNAPG